ncbi:CBS domain-containing protein [Methylobacter tundripaludum]|uniref:CBS domain-containing protein n=1 Tax=Methylobacter tundripaludum TaxID=173365 RepID=UPI000AB319E4|nr:CBS domain-containing protein [Methylobacter tundripaludum]
MSIGEFCNREVVFATREMSLPEAAQLMREYHVGDLVVVDEIDGKRMPVGIVTDRDMVSRLSLNPWISMSLAWETSWGRNLSVCRKKTVYLKRFD